MRRRRRTARRCPRPWRSRGGTARDGKPFSRTSRDDDARGVRRYSTTCSLQVNRVARLSYSYRQRKARVVGRHDAAAGRGDVGNIPDACVRRVIEHSTPFFGRASMRNLLSLLTSVVSVRASTAGSSATAASPTLRLRRRRMAIFLAVLARGSGLFGIRFGLDDDAVVSSSSASEDVVDVVDVASELRLLAATPSSASSAAAEARLLRRNSFAHAAQRNTSKSPSTTLCAVHDPHPKHRWYHPSRGIFVPSMYAMPSRPRSSASSADPSPRALSGPDAHRACAARFGDRTSAAAAAVGIVGIALKTVVVPPPSVRRVLVRVVQHAVVEIQTLRGFREARGEIRLELLAVRLDHLREHPVRVLAKLAVVELEPGHRRVHRARDVRRHRLLPPRRAHEHAQHLERARAALQLRVVARLKAPLEPREQRGEVRVHRRARRRRRGRARAEKHLPHLRPRRRRAVERGENNLQERLDVRRDVGVVQLFQPRVHRVHHLLLRRLVRLRRQRA
mmetsp:Transcript_3025/g.9971  ORF Transcript_3025/g.9971 Transcript_3025/m.9971 type:complete len:506 (-) Transcript_3025:1447-2964(-)